MKIIVVDFESYYSQSYSLSHLTNEEYVRSHEFEVIGVSVQIDDGKPEWFTGTMAETAAFLRKFDWENNLALAHNAAFDASILTWVFGIKPKGWLDTLSMGRALHGTEVGGSLAVLAKHYGVGTKGTEVVMAKGLRRKDFPEEQLAEYGKYCCNDTAMTYALFQKMSVGFPPSELRLIDLTIRMFSEPVLQLDEGILTVHLGEVKRKKQELLNKMLIEKDQLMSNKQLAKVLEGFGVVVPMKISPANGKQTYAFSKTDEEFKALLEHDNVIVQAIVAARLGVKSTIEETRTERFIGIARRGSMPVPLRYYAAHTGRWGGDDKLNLQNLPRKSPLKYSIIPPDGYVILDSDSSQIEARTLAWLAGQNDLVEAFDKGEDVYRIMASAIYGKDVSQITKDERFVGKTTILGCIGAGSMVLCDSGWKPIEQVTLGDKLWDGEEWVCHQGLVPKGEKETLSLSGLWLTPDHKVLCGMQWLEAQSVVADANILYRALGTGVENLPFMSPTTSDLYPEVPTLETNGKLRPSNRKLQTYDLAYAGPRNRYTVLTARGPMIVHNCGYGMGAAKFQLQLKNFGVAITLEEAKRIIDTYRATYPNIVRLWAEAGDMLRAMLRNAQTTLGRNGLLEVDGANGVKLPNGLYLKYPNLRVREDEKTGKVEVVYDTKKGKTVIPNRIYGGKVIENVCQALARIIIGEQMLRVAKKYRVVMTVHDAIAVIAPKAEAETAKEYIELCMRLRPSWALELPLNCESGYGDSYGDC